MPASSMVVDSHETQNTFKNWLMVVTPSRAYLALHSVLWCCRAECDRGRVPTVLTGFTLHSCPLISSGHFTPPSAHTGTLTQSSSYLRRWVVPTFFSGVKATPFSLLANNHASISMEKKKKDAIRRGCSHQPYTFSPSRSSVFCPVTMEGLLCPGLKPTAHSSTVTCPPCSLEHFSILPSLHRWFFSFCWLLSLQCKYFIFSPTFKDHILTFFWPSFLLQLYPHLSHFL